MDRDTSEVVIASYKLLLDNAKRLLEISEVEWCPDCHGTGRINPIENPPYKCDRCDGRGWISPWTIEAWVPVGEKIAGNYALCRRDE